MALKDVFTRLRHRKPWVQPVLFGDKEQLSFANVDPEDNEIVATCVEYYQRSFRGTPLRAYDSEGRRLQTAPPLLEFYERVRERRFLKFLVHDYLVFGNSYWVFDLAQGGGPSPNTFKRLDPRCVEYDRRTDEYVYNGDRYSQDRVLHFRNGFDPKDPFFGKSQVREVLPAIWLEAQAYQFGGTVLTRASVAGLIASLDEDFSKVERPTAEQLEQFRSQLKEGLAATRRGSSFFSSFKLKLDALPGVDRIDRAALKEFHNLS